MKPTCEARQASETQLLVVRGHFRKARLSLPYRCSLSDTTLDTMVVHSSLLVAISAHLFMFIPAYRETFPSHPHHFYPRPRLQDSTGSYIRSIYAKHAGRAEAEMEAIHGWSNPI